MGVGFLVVLPADDADRAVEHATTTGIPAWLLGEVIDLADRHASTRTTAELVSGAKGVDGGAVQVLGEHPEP